ncbi:hypothetical protein PG997_013017 [Apiospora hydei]|uniref:FAD-binding PCMH-type domain-containing protein n=1 Tax=Apiospora hydei TaxID=1337664 RepID=A0ABR1V501_9PEZI
MASVSKSIEAVKKLSSVSVHLPESQDYDELTSSYFSELERELRPACFLTPRSAQEVADILKAIQPFAGPSEVAICGSASRQHREWPMLATASPFICETSGDRDRQGKNSRLGGLSYFSYARGFVSDDVVNYEVVLANGDIVNANAETNRDLWIALKGGGNNFGIVTRFELNVFERGPMWGGKSLVEYHHQPEPDTSAHICLSLGYAAALGDIVCINDVFCSEPAKPKALKPFTDIQPQIDQMNTLSVNSLRESSRMKNSRVRLPTVSMMEQSMARGGNSQGLDPSQGPLVVVMFYTSWDQPEDDEVVFSVSKEALERIGIEGKSRHMSAQYRYLNYAFPYQHPIGSYGPESNARLHAVS